MIVRKAFRFKLVPTPAQEQAFRQYAGACRWVWNEMLRERKETYKATGKSPSMYEQKRRLTELKRQPETAWLNGIHSQVLQEPVINLHRAFVNFFEKRAKYPRFKPKRRGLGSFTFPQSVKVEGNRVWLPKIGWVRFRKSREIEGTIKRATIRHRESGWYLSLLCEIDMPDPEPVAPTEETTVGIDLGLKSFAALSTGETIDNPRHFRALEEKLGKAQRARKKRQAASIHARIANARNDFLHKLSTRLVRDYTLIAVGNVSAAKLAKTTMAKSVHDASWSTFRNMLRYKAITHGAWFEEVDESFTTQTCSSCGARPDSRPRGIAGLGIRQWVCSSCGDSHDRDVNAAKNILARSGHRAPVEGILVL